MGRYVLYLSGILITLVVFSSGSKNTDVENQILVKIDAKEVEVTCSLNTNGLPLKYFGWFKCENMERMKQCREERDKYIQAWIKNRTVINHYPEEYKLSVDRTLTILKMSPKYDGTVFFCIGQIEHHRASENTTIINIIKERPKIRIKSPQPFSVVEGMALHLDCKATGFPSPRVIWFRIPDMQMLQNRTNEEVTSLVRRNMTKDDEGEYICAAENPLGSVSYRVQVNVIDISSSTVSTPTGNQENREGDAHKVTSFALLSLLVPATVGCMVLL